MGIESEKFIEPKPGIPPSPSQIEKIKEYAKKNSIKAVVQATYYSTDAAKSIAEATEARPYCSVKT